MKISGDLAEILGMHVGDGCISITNRYKEYALSGDITEEREYYDDWIIPLFNKNIIKPLLNKEICGKEYKLNGTYGFYIFNSKIVDFFLDLGIPFGSKLNIGVPKQVLKNNKLTKRFLRGLFDTDGTLYFDRNRTAKSMKRNRPYIQLSTVSKNLSKQILKILFDLGYHPKWRKPYKGKRNKNFVYSVLIYRKNDIIKWIKEIGFKSPKHHTKWLVFKKLGHCPPYTTLAERKKILNSS